jgi:hypothetical protein
MGTWDLTRSVMGFPYSEVVTILGFQTASETNIKEGQLVAGDVRCEKTGTLGV